MMKRRYNERLSRLRRLRPPLTTGPVALDVAGLVKLNISGAGAVVVYEPGADLDAVSAAVRKAIPRLAAVALVPDNGRGDT